MPVPAAMRFSPLPVVVLVTLLMPAGVALGRNPTPLRLEARQATAVLSDGERYAIIQQRHRLLVAASGRAVHTRSRVYIASTLTFTTEGEPDRIRVFSARIPRRNEPARRPT